MPLLILLCLFLSSCFSSEIRVRSVTWAHPIIGSKVSNWYKVDDHLYRSAQPDDAGMKEIETFGIKNVLTLRDFHDDTEKVKKTSLKANRVEMSAGSVTADEVAAALRIIQKSDGPILVHCWHGSDRTGTVVAFYRILIQNWTREQALDEMVNGGYGYHAIYGNLQQLLKTADLEAMRAKIQAP